ncbi:MAG: hypothetical protein J6U85_00305, partial [Bacteroidales bacterium]|nr:hypothetical protein [Bacteroidales bacterium]
MKRFLSMLLMVMLLSPLTMKADEILVGTATGHSNLGPFVNSYPHSWIEMIYTAEEIGQACTIGSIAYQYAEGPKFPLNEIKIYLAETTKTSFETKADWTPENELKLVYSGVNVVIGGDEEWEVFELDTPFEYSGEKNLAVVISKTASYNELYLRWSCYVAEKNILFTASDTDPSFAQYPTAEGLATYDKKPIMKLTERAPQLDAPTNLRAYIRQDIPDYNYKYEITMAWDAVEGAQGYDVFVNTTKEQD